MQLIDDEGRIFGKYNLIDVAVGVVLIGIIPMSYGAFVLFRPPEPSLLSIEPTQVTTDAPDRVRVAGTYLNPGMRIAIGDGQAATFLVESQESAEIRLPDLEAGTYDIVLLNQAIELSRLSDALVVVESETPSLLSIDPTRVVAHVPSTIRIAGDLLSSRLRISVAGIPGEWDAEELFVASQELAEVRLPALEAGTYDIVLFDSALYPNNEEVNRLTDGLLVAEPVVAESEITTITSNVLLTVRFVSQPDVQLVMSVGDQDTSVLGNDFSEERVRELPVAEVQSVGPRSTMPGSATVGLPGGTPGPSYIDGQVVEVFDAVLDVPVTLRVGSSSSTTGLGWSYGEQSVRVGNNYMMETMGYIAHGWVLDMERIEPD